MKRKEYYWIGRLVCLLGYLFLALNAILNPWVPTDDFEKKTGQLYSLLDTWVYLIPIGFLILAITGRRKMDIVCTVLATLCCASVFAGWVVERDGAPNIGGPATILLFLIEKLFPEKNMLALALIAAVLYTGVAAITAVRAFSVGRWKVPLRILAVFTLVVMMFYVFSMFGMVDEGSLFQPVRDALDQWKNSNPQQFDKTVVLACKLTYAAMMVPAAVCIAAETAYDRKNNLEMR